MLTLDCPFCGPRTEAEFICGGESHIARPTPAESTSDAAWAAYLHVRDNPRGVVFERWRHAHGCGLWFNLARSTLDHRIWAVYAINAAKPDLTTTSADGTPQ